MHFLSTRFSQETTLNTFDNLPEQRETITEHQRPETHQNASDDGLMIPTAGSLRSKFCRLQTLNTEPPEMLYENEAWAPKYERIEVFRKHRINAE